MAANPNTSQTFNPNPLPPLPFSLRFSDASDVTPLPYFYDFWMNDSRFYSPEDGYEFMYPQTWVGDSVSFIIHAAVLHLQIPIAAPLKNKKRLC